MARRGPEFTPEEIDRALVALALNNGNGMRAHETLKQDKTLTRTPSWRVLYQWRDKHAERYQQIRTELAPKIEQDLIHDWRDIAAISAAAQRKLALNTLNGADDLTPSEAAQAQRNVAIAAGVAADKLALWTDRPTSRIEHRDPEQILRAIETLVGTAEEIEDAEITEPDRSPEVDKADRSPLTQESAASNPRELAA